MNSEDRAELVGQLNDLGQLASGVGHHVINAFSAIVSNAELLRMSAEAGGGGEPARIANAIIKTAVDASGVARRLIDYSRSATATGDAAVRLDQVVARFVEQQRRDGPPGIEWSADLKPVPPILGNEAQLMNLFELLIRNSVEAMPPAGGTIHFHLNRDDRGWLLLDIKDNGQGMSPKVQERALEPFYTTKGGHLGVGLSIAYGIWRRHRGTLAVHSQPGEGSRVRLSIEPTRTGP